MTPDKRSEKEEYNSSSYAYGSSMLFVAIHSICCPELVVANWHLPVTVSSSSIKWSIKKYFEENEERTGEKNSPVSEENKALNPVSLVIS